MKCPHCGCESSRVMECRRLADGLKRFRLCRRCGERFPTMETLSEPRRRGRAEEGGGAPALSLVGDAAAPAQSLPPTQAEPRRRAQERVAGFHPVARQDIADDVRGMPDELVDLLLLWWNTARRSRHGSRAAWTRNAWQQSVDRIRAMPPDRALRLSQAGAEFGWMALKPEYLAQAARRPAAPVASSGRPLPRDPAMLAAIDSWPADPA